LTSISIGTVWGCVKLNACFSFVIRRQVSLFHEFMISMCEWALCLKFAFAKEFPVSAHLGLKFDLVLFYKVVSFLLTGKMLLRFLHCSFFIEFFRSPIFIWRMGFARFAVGPVFVVIFINLSRSIRNIIIRLLLYWFLIFFGYL
jgi:hypothetical protein